MPLIELLEKAARGAALVCGHTEKPTLSRLAECLGVRRAQVTRWASGTNMPSKEHFEELLRLADFDEVVQEGREKMSDHLLDKGQVTVRLHGFDGWPLSDFAKVGNPMAADFIPALVKRRRSRRECDLCGATMPRTMYPANYSPPSGKKRYAARPRYLGDEVGKWVCSRCRREQS